MLRRVIAFAALAAGLVSGAPPAPPVYAPPAPTCAADWAQCGGLGWTGPPACCTPDTTCWVVDTFYSQCMPGVYRSEPVGLFDNLILKTLYNTQGGVYNYIAGKANEIGFYPTSGWPVNNIPPPDPAMVFRTACLTNLDQARTTLLNNGVQVDGYYYRTDPASLAVYQTIGSALADTAQPQNAFGWPTADRYGRVLDRAASLRVLRAVTAFVNATNAWAATVSAQLVAAGSVRDMKAIAADVGRPAPADYPW